MSESSHPDYDDDDGLAVQEIKPKLKRPPLYKVVLINDEYTPWGFVVHVLQLFFMMDTETAENITRKVHNEGRGICGTYTRDVAETKVAQVNGYSRKNQHPLLCTMEQA